jgi:hypothetical protein
LLNCCVHIIPLQHFKNDFAIYIYRMPSQDVPDIKEATAPLYITHILKDS